MLAMYSDEKNINLGRGVLSLPSFIKKGGVHKM